MSKIGNSVSFLFNVPENGEATDIGVLNMVSGRSVGI